MSLQWAIFLFLWVGLVNSIPTNQYKYDFENGPSRMIVVELTNNVKGQNLYGGTHYSHGGFSSTPPETNVPSLSSTKSVFKKASFAATGTSGIIVYRIGSETKTDTESRFAIFWSVPFDRNFAANWFGLKFLEKQESANEELFNEASTDPLWGATIDDKHRGYSYASTGRPVVISKNDYIITATMTDSPQSVLKVVINSKAVAAVTSTQNPDFLQDL